MSQPNLLKRPSANFTDTKEIPAAQTTALNCTANVTQTAARVGDYDDALHST